MEVSTLFIAAHELTHFIKQWSPDKFKVLANFLVQQYGENGVFVSELVQRQLDKAKRNGRKLTWDEAYEEMVADSMEAMLTDGNVVQMMADLKQQDKTLWQKICDWFKNLANDLKELVDAYKDYKPDSPEGRMVADMQDAIVIFESIYADAPADASGNFQGAEKNTTGEGGEVRMMSRESNYDYSKPFSQQVDDWINGSFPVNDTLLVGGTPDVLKGIGFPSLPITISQTNLKANISGQYRGTATEIMDHIISSADFKRLPELIADPVAIIADRRLQSNKWVISEHVVDVLVEMEINGKQTLVPIKIDGKGMQNGATIDALSISSVHGNKDAYNRLEYALTNDSDSQILAFYVNKNKATAVLRKAGYTITGWPNIHNGSNHTITDKNSPVKLRITAQTETRQFKKWFRGSKIINADGTPKVMYHGSPAQFTIFDKKKAKSSGLYGKGFYFTDSESHAGVYGNKYAVYLNIRNPLESGKATVDRKQVRKFLETVADNEDYSIENYGTYDVDVILKQIMGSKGSIDAFRFLQDINATAIGDLVEATELFNSVNGTEFDGIVVPTEVVAFRPEQIKSATDNIGTFDSSNPDIRYSDRDPAAGRVNEVLQNENAKLKEDVQYLKDLVKLQKTVTGGKKFTKSSVEAMAGNLMKANNAKGNKQELAKLLNGLYEYIAKGEDLTWDGVKEMAQPAVQWLRTKTVNFKSVSALLHSSFPA